MRDTKRIPRVVGLLYDLWRLHPDQRLGQLVMNIPTMAGLKIEVDIFNCEDDLWESLLEKAISISIGGTKGVSVECKSGEHMTCRKIRCKCPQCWCSDWMRDES